MSKQVIRTDNAPAAIGPYSQAVKAGGFLYISGQLALDPATGDMIDEEISGQARQAMENVKAILEEAGYTFDDVVSATVYLQNMDDFAAMNKVYAEYFVPDNCPARAAIEVAALPRGGLVEVVVVAYKA